MRVSYLLTAPWPWYVAGPLIGLFPALLLVLGNRLFGVSSNLRHLCAAVLPLRKPYFSYDWRSEGGWNLLFALLGSGLTVMALAILSALAGTATYGSIRTRLPH